MVRTVFTIKGLVPEKYNDYNIYTKKFTTGPVYKPYDVYVVKIARGETVIHTFVHYGPHSVYGYGGTGPATKETALDEAKKYIDEELAGKQTEVPQVGDIYVTSWGYDQTNYDYIMITAVSPSGKTVKARRVRHKQRGYSGQAYIQEPVREPFGPEFQLTVKYWRGEIHLVGSYPYGSHGDMTDKRPGSFTKHKEGETYAETDPVFGH